MKRVGFLITLILYTCAGICQIQYGKVLDSTYYNPGWGNLDYTIPESPAFKILGTNPDNILHPVSVKNIALSVGDYFLTSGASIPKSLAVQFSPFLLANNNTSLNNYNKNKFLSRLSFSIGTSVQGSAYSVAEGLNITILDKTDLKAMPEYLKALSRFAQEDVAFFDQAIVVYQKNNPGQSIIQIKTTLSNDTANTSQLYKTIDSIEQKLMISSGVADLDVIRYRDSVKNSSWNKPIWQVALATLQSSPDSLIKNLQFSQISLWSSTGLPLGHKTQILIGLKLGFVDSLTWQTNFSAGARLFYGTNSFKGFIQGEYDDKNKVNNYTMTAGCQFNMSNGIWGQFAINISVNSAGKVTYQPGFNVGLGTGEKKKS
jgi:hypothetical protein